MSTETTSYFEERIQTASPLELIQLLYDAAIDRVRAARLNLREGDAMARSHDVSKAMEICAELTLALSDREAKDYVATYSAIYRHMQQRLLDAHSRQSDGIFAEVEETLVSLANNWREVRDIVQKGEPRPLDVVVKPISEARQPGIMYNSDAIADRADAELDRSGRQWNL